ncbi:hypothetical protein E4U34_007893 [Claviceps purpurea]|nr:hypothetical protein E4U34_007893 [Claviceps purpurea]KAG6260592.1 hypothetical protein E4U47_000371 [Claviceps purpurea]
MGSNGLSLNPWRQEDRYWPSPDAGELAAGDPEIGQFEPHLTQLGISPEVDRPYSAGRSSIFPHPLLPPISAILSGPCPPPPILTGAYSTDTGTSRDFCSFPVDPSPPAAIPRGPRPAGTGSSVGVAHQNPLREARRYFVPIDKKKASTEAQLRRNLNARSSDVYRLKKQVSRKITEMEDKYKDSESRTREVEEKLRREREEAQRIIRQKDEALRRKDEENRYLRQQLENKK